MSYPQPPYPPAFDTESLGTLRPPDPLNEHIFAPSQRPVLRGHPVELLVHVVSEGRIDMARVPAQIDRYWRNVVGAVDELLERSYAEVDEAIDSFWEMDEPPPTASALIAHSVLESVHLNCDHEEGWVEFWLFDKEDLIGRHDLVIAFDEDLNPSSAGFQG